MVVAEHGGIKGRSAVEAVYDSALEGKLQGGRTDSAVACPTEGSASFGTLAHPPSWITIAAAPTAAKAAMKREPIPEPASGVDRVASAVVFWFVDMAWVSVRL